MKFIRKIIICLKYLFTKQDEYEYYGKNGELVMATGRHILDIIEDNNIKDKSLREMTVSMEQMKFKMNRVLLDLIRLQRFTPEYNDCYHKDKCKYNCGHEQYGMCWYYHIEEIIDKLL